MIKLYTPSIVIGILAQIVLFIFFDRKTFAYGPIIFWVIASFALLNYIINIIKLSNSVKRTKPKLYEKFSFGIMITRNALSDDEFLNALDYEEQEIVDDNKTIFKFFFLCFGLFTISTILVALLLFI